MIELFRTVRRFVARHAGGLLCAGLAIRQLIIWDWFGAILAFAVGIGLEVNAYIIRSKG